MLWPILGAVRFLLALIVAAEHTRGVNAHPGPLCEFLGGLSAFAALLGFFIVSGFSIAASYARQPTGFYFRRALRILPLYVLAVVFASVAILPLGGIPTRWPQALGNLFFLQGFVCDALQTNQMLWTISIEVVFYLVTPLLARMTSVSIALIVAASVILYVAADRSSVPYYSNLRYGSAVPLLAWSWLVGFLAYRLRPAIWRALLVAGIAGMTLTLAPSHLRPAWPVTIGIVALSIAFAARVKAPHWLSRTFEWLGDISYPLYLFHYPLFLVYFGLSLPQSGLSLLAIAIVFSVGLDRLFDKPVKAAILHRFHKRSSPKPIGDITVRSRSIVN